MRFANLFLISVVHAPVPPPNACLNIDSLWFDDLVYCGVVATGAISDASMQTCFSAGNLGTSPAPNASAALANYIAAVRPCTICAIAFSSAVYVLPRFSLETSCGFALGAGVPIWDTDSHANIRTSTCLDLMWTAITAMNTCMTTSGGTDIVTGVSNFRCAAFGDFNTNVDAVYRPWDQLVVQALAQSSSTFNTGALAAGAGTALGLISPCNWCFNSFYMTLYNLKLGYSEGPDAGTAFTTDCTNPFSIICLNNMYVAAALASFVTCTGGDHIDTAAPPSLDCSDIPDGSWFTQLVASGIAATGTPYDASSLSTYIKSIGSQGATLLTGHLDATDSCSTPILDFANAVFALKSSIGTDCNSATSSGCLVWLYDAINTANGDEAMARLDLVTGLTSVRCTNTEWTKLTYKYRSMVPMYIAAKYANSFAGAITAMPNNADLTNLEEVINGIGCQTCFDTFVWNVNSYYADNKPLMDAACADPYTAGCVAALVTQLNDFTTSSGQVLNWSAISTTCTSAQFDALLKANVTDNVLAATTSPSVVSFVTVLNAVHDTIGTDNLDAPCWLCFTELARGVFNLGRTDLATCVADITGAACYAIIGEYINGFQDCSGFAFVLAPVTTAVPATSETTTSSTATTTADRTITTVVSTTSATTTTASSSPKLAAVMEVISMSLTALLVTAIYAR